MLEEGRIAELPRGRLKQFFHFLDTTMETQYTGKLENSTQYNISTITLEQKQMLSIFS